VWAPTVLLFTLIVSEAMTLLEQRTAHAEQQDPPYPSADEGSTTEKGGLLSSWNIHGDVEAGGQTLSGNTNSPTLFEYRDLKGKPTIPNLRIRGDDQQGADFFELGGTNMTRTDAFFFLNGGRYNSFRFDFDYDRLPHTIGVNRSMIYSDVGLGDLQLNSDQCNNVGAFNAAPGTTPAQRNAIQGSVNCLLAPTQLGHQTDTARIGFLALPLTDLEIKLTYSRRNKEGTRPFGGVFGSAGFPVTEFAAPRNERIHDMSTGLNYAKDWYQVGATYNLSLFENSVDQIQWQNVCGTGAACGNPSGFGRIAPMPDNVSHSFSGTGGMNLPWWQTRLAGTLSYNLWRQNQSFLPYSTIAGAGNANDQGATSPDANMNVLLMNFNVTSKPIRDVTLNVRYRYYDLVNNTPTQSFTGVLRSGDLGVNPGTISTVPIAFRRQNLSTDATWRLTSKITAKAGYEWVHWGRSYREAAVTNENIGKATIDYRPRNWISTGLKYSLGVRTVGADGYIPLDGNATALPQLRKFDEADRTRHKGEFLVRLTPIETLTITGNFFGQTDNYFNSAYGLQNSTAYGYAGDIVWAAMEHLNVVAGYAHDDYQSSQLNCNIGFGQTTCNPANNYSAHPRDLLDTVRVGFSLTAIPDRLEFNVDYRYTYGRSKFGMAGSPGGAPAAQPANMPDIINVTHAFNLSSKYRVTPRWTLNFLFMYERYTESDWTVDNVTPSLANLVLNGFTTTSPADVRSVLLPILHPSYEAYFTAFSLAYTF